MGSDFKRHSTEEEWAEMRELIHEGAGEHELESEARRLTPSIHQDGQRRVLAGETSLEELLRVTQED